MICTQDRVIIIGPRSLFSNITQYQQISVVLKCHKVRRNVHQALKSFAVSEPKQRVIGAKLAYDARANYGSRHNQLLKFTLERRSYDCQLHLDDIGLCFASEQFLADIM